MRKKNFLEDYLSILFYQSSNPQSVADIVSQLKKKHINYHRSTLFRAINRLKEKGLIKELIINNEKKFYESATIPHHHHLICYQCKKIVDVDLDQKEKFIFNLSKLIQEKYCFRIKDHLLEFYGLCKNCQKGLV